MQSWLTLDEKIEIEKIDGFPKELEDLQEMWNSFYIDLIATRKSESSPWLCFGLVFKLSNQIFPYKTEIRYNLNDRLIIAHYCEKFSFERFTIVLREIIQGTLTLDSLQFKMETFDMRHFIFERRPGWSREGLIDEEGWPAHIFRSYLRGWELINSLQEFDELLIMHEEPYNSIPELTRKYLHGIEIGGVKAGAIYGVIPRYFKLENLKLDETGNVDVDVESHMCINPSDLMISVIIKDESDHVLNSYIVPLDRTQCLRSKENFWVINKHINNDLKGVSEARLSLAYKKSIVVYEDWIQFIEPSEMMHDREADREDNELPTIRIFLSYSNKDKNLSGELKEKLENQGIKSFLAHEDIEPSKEWEEEIIRNLKECDIFIPIINENFKESEWTDQESGFAFSVGKLIIPIDIGLVPYGFIGRYQALKYDGNINHACDEIMDTILKSPNSDKFKDFFIKRLVDSEHFREANPRAKALKGIESFTENQINEIISGYVNNYEIRGGNESRPFVYSLYKKYSDVIDPELKEKYEACPETKFAREEEASS